MRPDGQSIRYRATGPVALVLVVVALGLGLGGCGTASSTHSSSASRSTSSSAPRGPSGAAPGHLTVAPTSGVPSTIFTVHFTAGTVARTVDGEHLGYELSLSGPQQGRCVSQGSAPLAAATAGAASVASLNPRRLGGSWCRGTYAIRMTEIARPVCAAGTVCPQYLRVVGVVGRGSFRVR